MNQLMDWHKYETVPEPRRLYRLEWEYIPLREHTGDAYTVTGEVCVVCVELSEKEKK